IDYRSVLLAAWIASVGGRLAILRAGSGCHAHAEILSGGGMKEVKEVEEVQEVKEKRGAAFFDIDGTLLAKPPLERRFFGELRWQGKILTRNYFLWIAEAVRLAL